MTYSLQNIRNNLCNDIIQTLISKIIHINYTINGISILIVYFNGNISCDVSVLRAAFCLSYHSWSPTLTGDFFLDLNIGTCSYIRSPIFNIPFLLLSIWLSISGNVLNHVPDGLFQLQLRISFQFLRAKGLHRFSLIMRTCSFLTLLYVRGTYTRLVYTWYNNIFRMIAVLIVFLAVNEKKESNENYIKTRQRQDREKKVLLLATR